MKNRKSIIRLKDLNENEWFNVNYFQKETFLSEDKERVYTIKLDSDNFITYLSHRHAEVLFSEVFGLNPDGTSKTKNPPVDSLAVFPGLQFAVTEKKDVEPTGIISIVEFRVKN